MPYAMILSITGGEEVGQQAPNVDGDGHLLQGIAGQGASRTAEGDDDRAVPPHPFSGR